MSLWIAVPLLIGVAVIAASALFSLWVTITAIKVHRNTCSCGAYFMGTTCR